MAGPLVLDAQTVENKTAKTGSQSDKFQMTNKKILVIHTAFIGDIVLLTPLVETLVSELKNSEIHLLLTPVTKNVFEHHPQVSKIITFDKNGAEKGFGGFNRIRKRLRSEQYDIVLSPHRSLRSALLAKLSGATIRIGFNTSAGSLFFNRKVSYLNNVHEIIRNLEFAAALGITKHVLLPVVYSSDSDAKVITEFFEKHNISKAEDIIALAPGSIWPTKRWPLKYYTELAQKLTSDGLTVFIIGGKDDKDMATEIARNVAGKIIDTTGLFALSQTALVLKKCSVLVSNDSAPMHLATAVNTPVIAIFGPTVKELGFYPTGKKDLVIEKNLKCRPCGTHGGNKCPIKTFECMKSISTADIYSHVSKYIK